MPLRIPISPSGMGRSSQVHDEVTGGADSDATLIPQSCQSIHRLDAVERLVISLEASNTWFRGRSERVAQLAARIATQLRLNQTTVEHVRLAGRLHDVGMSRIRKSVLEKPGVLSPEEVCHVREHVRIGVDLLTPLLGHGPVLDYIQDHHERFDGKGYPRGLTGAGISLGGRILMAADAFDALTSQRPYREPLSSNAALSRLSGDAGRALDPDVYGALRSVVMARAAEAVLRDQSQHEQGGAS